MDQQTLPIGPSPIVLDEIFFVASPQTRGPDELLLRDLPSSEEVTQQGSMWNAQTPFQAQYSGDLLSQPEQFNLGGFACWEDYMHLATGHMAAPNSMTMQAANDMNSSTVSFQVPTSTSTDWMYANALRPQHDVAGQQTFYETFIETPSTIAGYIPYHDAVGQSMNFEAVQEPASSLLPHNLSSHSATIFTGRPTTMDPASSEPLQVPRISEIMASGPVDFDELGRQSLQSSDYEEWRQAAQGDGSGFESASLDAPQMPDPRGNGARSAHVGLSTPPNQMVLPTRRREFPQSAAPTTYNMHLPIAPRLHSVEIAPSTSSQTRALVPSANASRRSSSQSTSKLNNKTIRKPGRPNKHLRGQGVGAVGSLPGCKVYQLETFESLNAVKKHNSRYGKERGSSEQLTRNKGACISCSHRKEKCDWTSSETICALCAKRIESGGATVIGIRITSCLTTFQQAVKGLDLSDRQSSYLEALARVTLLKNVSDSDTATCEVALLLDRLSNPKFWRTLPISQATNLALQLAYFTCCLPPILAIGSSEEFIELSLYHMAFLWQCLPRSSRTALVEVFIKLRLILRVYKEGTNHSAETQTTDMERYRTVVMAQIQAPGRISPYNASLGGGHVR